MTLCTFLVVLILLACQALSQTGQRYCDPASSICYSRWTDDSNITFGVALPDVADPPYDAILQIVSPIAYNGWVGFSWGGSMLGAPLTVGWVDKAANTTIVSSRMTYGRSLPDPYPGAEYTYLEGTGCNDTHWTLNVRCKGCSSWLDFKGQASLFLKPSDNVTFAYALSDEPPQEPSNNESAFAYHSSTNRWSLDMTLGHNRHFDKLVAANILPDEAPVSSTPPSATSTTAVSTAIRVLSPSSVQDDMPTACSGVPALRFPARTAPGWKAVKVAGNLQQPRGVIIDASGNLLVVEKGLGITAHKIRSDGCLGASKIVITQRSLNHGIVLSKNGKTLYASSATKVFAWAYDAKTQTVGATFRTVVTGMSDSGHVTRTLAIPNKHPNLLIVSHGSRGNFDYAAGDIKTARACVKVFNLSTRPAAGYNYVTEGYQLGYGLRNEVGLAFDGDGMVWGVENSGDAFDRTINGQVVDIHQDNPAEELNYLGDPAQKNTRWYGYPTCFTVWKPDAFTDRTFAIGDQFVLAPNNTFTDDTCKKKAKPVSLAFQAHAAPLDAVFDRDYQRLYVTFHGSWDRDVPTGFKVVQVPFSKPGVDSNRFGPSKARSSGTGYNRIFWSADVTSCGNMQCFRPVCIAKDRHDRMYVTSDSNAEGEIILLGKV